MTKLRDLPGTTVACPHLTLDSGLTQSARIITVGVNQRIVLCGVCCDVIRGKFASEIIKEVVSDAVKTR